MSCEISVKSFNPLEIKVDGFTRDDVINLEGAIICALNQKLDRLSVLTRGCNVYSSDGNILINDAYNTSSCLLSLLETLGFDVREIECELKGKNYIVSDKLLASLRSFGNDYKFNHKIINCALTPSVKEIISNNKFNVDLDLRVLDMILNIKQNGCYMELAKQEIITDYKDNKFVSELRGDIISSSLSINEDLSNIFNGVKENLVKTNEILKNATASIIAYRAKQMGYSIKEVRNGNKIELELVRCE